MAPTTNDIAAAFCVPIEIVDSKERHIKFGAEVDATYRDVFYTMQPLLELAVKACKEDDAG